MRTLLLLCALLGCGADETKPTIPTNTTPPVGSAAPTSPILSDAIRTKICNHEPCGGEMSLINVYRSGNGTVKKLYRLYGRCSHNAGLYFDPDGTNTETIPEKPIDPDSDEAKQFQAKHDKQVGGLQKTDVISCRDGARSAP